MAEPIQEYLIGLGFKLDSPGAKRFGDTLENTAKGFAHAGEAATAMATAIGVAVEKVASRYEDLYYLSQRTGSTIQSLQATAYGFTQIGLSANDAKGMVDSLATSIRTNPGIGALMKTIGAKGNDANSLAISAVERFSQMPFFIAAQYAGMIGWSPEQLLMAEQGFPGLKIAMTDYTRRLREAGVETESLGDKSHVFMTAVRKLGSEFGILEDKIGQDFVEPATWVVNELELLAEGFGRADVRSKGFISTMTAITGTLLSLAALKSSLGWIAGLFGGSAPTVAPVTGTAPATSAAATVFRAAAARVGFAAATIDIAEGSGNKAVADLIKKRDIELGLSDKPADVLRDILATLHSIDDKTGKDLSFGGLADVHFGGAINPYNQGAGASIPTPSRVARSNVSPRETLTAAIRASEPDLDIMKAHVGASVAMGRPDYDRTAREHAILGAAMTGSAPLGSDSWQRGARSLTVSPTTTINVHGGSDPHATADAVLNGQASVINNVTRSAGIGMR